MKDFPAFPFEYHNQTSAHQRSFVNENMVAPGASEQYAGMSMRDYFAAKAIAALDPPFDYVGDNETQRSYREWARKAYQMADALLAARGSK